jgi:FtsP/CotA-like multicopper oxidase with cupredoxin domain
MNPTRLAAEYFPTDVDGLAERRRLSTVDLADGDSFDLRIAPVVSEINGTRVRMLAYNGSIPGPTLRVPQGASVTVNVRNDADSETTVHWHGLRLDNAYDGVPFDTQAPIPPGGTFTYRLRCPDPGVYWYHPHMREDYGLELGLYGNLVVTPANDDYWAPANREVVVTVDDVLIENGSIFAFDRSGPTHVAMGRFGNVMLAGGETSLDFEAQTGEVVRFYFTNTANARLFNLALPGARMKLVGGDSGRCEHEAYIEEALLAPSERAIVDVLFDTPGRVPLQHRTPDRTYQLGSVHVSDVAATPSYVKAFDTLRTSNELQAERIQIDGEYGREPDKTLTLMSLIPGHNNDPDPTATGESEHRHHVHFEKPQDGLEWEDLMPEMNAATNAQNMSWTLIDEDAGTAHDDIDWSFRVGDRVKIRLVNPIDQHHPMYHPFHIHGAGRFLVLSVNDVPHPNLVWKDTVLVPAGHTVDILFEVTNPGLWMAHCHIAEHNQGGMMFSFRVTEDDQSQSSGATQ